MNISQCGRVQAQLLLYLAGELPPSKAAMIRDHVRTCPACNAQLQALSATQKQVKAALSSPLTVPAHFDARVMERVRRSARTQSAPRSRLHLAPLRRIEKQILMVMAGLCLLGGTYLAANSFLHRTTLTNAAGEGVADSSQVALLRDDYLREAKEPVVLAVNGSDPTQVAKDLSAQICPTHNCVLPVVFKAAGVKMLGGGWCQSEGHKITFTAYQWDGQRVIVYQGDQTTLSFPPSLYHPAPDGDLCYEPVQGKGVSGVVWGKGTTRYVMFAPLASDRLLSLAYSMQSAS